jgi:hypothetical protein
VSEPVTFPSHLVSITEEAIELLAMGIRTGAGKLREEQGYWPSFAYVELNDNESGASEMFTFMLVASRGVIYYESLFKVQFPKCVEFVVLPIDFRESGCNRLQ